MAQDFGNGVSRTLSASNRQFQVVVWQASKPPLDSELNLMAQVDWERAATENRAKMHSGWLLDPVRASADYVTHPDWSNWLLFGNEAPNELSPILWANVNGWIIPVTGTSNTDAHPSNRINLWPPPDSDTRIDFVFLEAWLAQVAPNPSTENKPSAAFIWKYGNTMFGGTNEPDDIEDPTIGFETTERLQVQYRIRVFGSGDGAGQSVDLATWPDGLDDTNVLAQGAGSSPVVGVTWTNMRDELGDPGLWRAGDGDPTNDLKTVDGYSYAIPICAVFRRNSDNFVAALNGSTAANQNGAMDRNPFSVALTSAAEAAKTFTSVTLTNDLAAGATGSVDLTGLAGSGWDNSDLAWDHVFVKLGDEIIHVTTMDAATGTMTINTGSVGTTDQGRGRYGTQDTVHPAGTPLTFFNSRPDGLFSDQIINDDILDMRRGVTASEWDYDQLLAHNLSKLLQGELQSTWKQGAVNDDEGAVVVEVDTLWNDGSSTVPAQTVALDGPDGIRTGFSDAAIIQSDVTLLLADQGGAAPVSSWVSSHSWDVSADFSASGQQTDAAGVSNGDSVFLFIGGNDGTSGARGSMRAGTERAVRFVNPREMDLLQGRPNPALADLGMQTPVTVQFLSQQAMATPTAGEMPSFKPGPQYPLSINNYEFPFLFLGGLLDLELQATTVDLSQGTSPGGLDEIVYTGLNFDTTGDWYDQDSGGNFRNDPSVLTHPVYHGRNTIYGLITNNGKDRSGLSSEMYIVVTACSNATNNGVYRVMGAGMTAGYTPHNASAHDRLVVAKVEVSPAAMISENNVSGEARSWMTSAEDGTGAVTGQAAACIVFTDLDGVMNGLANPWNSGNLGANAIVSPLTGDFLVSLTLAYSPGRGGTARVANKGIDTFAVIQPGSSMLRQAPTSIDPVFYSEAGVVSVAESYFPPEAIQTWSRLGSRGLSGPKAPQYGGGRIHLSEESREAELFVDPGSKTVLFRPFQHKGMTLPLYDVSASGALYPATYAHGPGAGSSIDGAGLFQGSRTWAYSLPPQYMPRFGRQDIPYYQDTSGAGTGSFLEGVNHLFHDNTSDSSQVFNAIGGADNGGVAGVGFMYCQTGDPATTGLEYGQYGAISGGAGTCYQGRCREDVNVISSDTPRGLRGIELPPYLGIARIYGVYDMRDWDGIGAWESDRVTPVTGHIPNLLRTGADKQTLYIKQGGGMDVTGDSGSHTYMIPEDVIDIRRSAHYTDGEDWDDFDFLVQFTCFGFGTGFIDQNNYVAVRIHNGEGNDPTALGDLTDCEMVIPAAAPNDTQAYIAYRRSVYQGDPYMTKGLSVRSPGLTDYSTRYGQVSVANAYEIHTAIQQYDNAHGYTQIPEKPNPRSLEILAACDFYTTLGTGKVGGQVYPGTITDVGYLNDSGSRIPASATANQYQVATRAFTEGQPPWGNQGGVVVSIAYNNLLSTADGHEYLRIRRGEEQVTYEWGSATLAVGADAVDSALLLMNEMVSGTDANRLIRGLRVQPFYLGGNQVYLTACDRGEAGEQLIVEAFTDRTTGTDPGVIGMHLDKTLNPPTAVTGFRGAMPSGGHQNNLTNLNSFNLGSPDIPMNAGAHPSMTTPVNVTGMTERLPLGILVQDSDFIGEDPLRIGMSFDSKETVSNFAPSLMSPLGEGGEYRRIMGEDGASIGMVDGAIEQYLAYSYDAPAGVKQFRLYRGGGSLYNLDKLPGGPVEWSFGGWSKEDAPVLKGAALVGRAFLVRNYKETAFSTNDTTSYGDEVQMVVATTALYGSGVLQQPVGYQLAGQISPTGYGKGYSAADRYRLEGYPMVSGYTKGAEDANIELAPYPNIDPVSDDPCP